MQDMENLRQRIIGRLNEPAVEMQGDIISFYDLYKACEEEMHPFAKFFNEDTASIMKKVNLRSKIDSIVGKRTPSIIEVVPTVRDGESIVVIKLMDDEFNYMGDIEVVKDQVVPRLVGFNQAKLKEKGVTKFLLDCVSNFKHELGVLDYFQERHPGIDYNWSIKNPDSKSVFSVDDGFLSGKVKLNDPHPWDVTLSQSGDLGLATYRTRRFGYLYDYIDFYNDDFKKRIPVNINDLNPLMRQIVEEKYELNKGPVLK